MTKFCLAVSVVLAVPASAFGALRASAIVTGSGTGPAFHYAASVNDSGTTPIGTFWYAWVPGEDFLLSSPTNVISPAGWTETITHLPATSTNGFAIQWIAGSTAVDIPAGGSLSGFGFDSTDTLAQVQGNSAFYPTTPTGTAFVYIGAPFADPGFQFVASTVAAPEPASLSLAVAGALLLIRRHR